MADDESIEILLDFLENRLITFPEFVESWVADYIEDPSKEKIESVTDFTLGVLYGNKISLEDVINMVTDNGFDLN